MMVEIVRSTDPRRAELVGLGAMTRYPHKVELDFGSVHPAHRGRGLGSALGSHAIVTNYQARQRNFATGGAAINDASKATVTSLGFTIDDLCRSCGPAGSGNAGRSR